MAKSRKSRRFHYAATVAAPRKILADARAARGLHRPDCPKIRVSRRWHPGRALLRITGLLLLAITANRAAEAGKNYLVADDFTPAIVTKLADCAKETLDAALAGRSPITPADLPPALTGAANGVEISIIRDGKIIAQGSALEQNSLLANLRLAAGRALFGFTVENFSQCSLWLTLFDAGKDSPSPAPVMTPVRGANAYQLRSGEQTFFIGALRPLLNQWSWQETLDKTLAEKLPDSTPASRLEFLVSPTCKIRVFAAVSLAIPPSPSPAILIAENPPAMTAEKFALAWDGVLAWWKNHQMDNGLYAIDTNAREQLTLNALAAAALGFLWRETRDPELLVQTQKLLTALFAENFLEAPDDDFGYLRADANPANEDLLATTFAFWALELCEQQQNPAFAARYQQMRRWVARGVHAGGWTLGGKEFSARLNSIAAVALLTDDAARHGAAVLKNLNRFAADRVELATLPWYTRAQVAAYEATRQKKLLADAVALNVRTLAAFDEPTASFPAATAEIAASLFSVTQITPVLKILGAAANFPHADKLRDWANRGLPQLLSRQILTGTWLEILRPESADHGSFVNDFHDLRRDYSTMIAATFALVQARKNFAFDK